MSLLKIADHADELPFQANGIAVVEVQNKKICIARYSKTLFAFPFTCPHAGGILANGHIDALGRVVCPLHRYRFDLKSGHNVSGEGFFLKRWPVAIQEAGIFVEMGI